jgi:hypothetical protein
MKLFYLALDLLCKKLISFQFNEGGCDYNHSQPIMDKCACLCHEIFTSHMSLTNYGMCAHECVFKNKNIHRK